LGTGKLVVRQVKKSFGESNIVNNVGEKLSQTMPATREKKKEDD